jgi:hypothetical protein
MATPIPSGEYCLETMGTPYEPKVNRTNGILAGAAHHHPDRPQRRPKEIPAWEIDQHATRRIIALIDGLFPETPMDFRAINEIRIRVLTLCPLVLHDITPTPHVAPMPDQPTEPSKPCTCWEDTNKELKENGYRISGKLTQFQVKDNDLLIVRCLPIERTDSKRLKRGEPSTMVIKHCPFCGAPI